MTTKIMKAYRLNTWHRIDQHWNDKMFELPQAFTDPQREVILKYFVSGRTTLTSSEWQVALTGFNLLHQAIVQSGA